MTIFFTAWDDDDEDRESYTPEQWGEAREFVGEVFTEINRPYEWLLRMNAEVRGDESGGTAWNFAAGLTTDQRRRLQRHLLEELTRELERPELPGPSES